MVNTGSFIPEKKGKTGTVRRRRKVYVLNYISYTFFFGAALTVAGLFLWSFYLDNQIDSATEELGIERQRFSQGDIERVRELDQRLGHIEALLRSTPLTSQILDAVEAAIPSNMDYSSLLLVQTGAEASAPEDPFATTVAYNNYDSYTMTIEGETQNFNKLLFQQQIMNNSSVLMGARVSDFNYDDSVANGVDVVSFNIVTEVPFSAVTSVSGVSTVPAAVDVTEELLEINDSTEDIVSEDNDNITSSDEDSDFDAEESELQDNI